MNNIPPMILQHHESWVESWVEWVGPNVSNPRFQSVGVARRHYYVIHPKDASSHYAHI